MVIGVYTRRRFDASFTGLETGYHIFESCYFNSKEYDAGTGITIFYTSWRSIG
jgi:hypothetical protein